MANLPAEITTERIAGGVRYHFPRRNLPGGRVGGVVLTVIGLLITGFMAAWMGMPIASGLEMLEKGEWFGYLLIGFGLLGLPGLLVGLGLVVAGLLVFFNRVVPQIELRDGQLIGIEKVGPIRWKRKRALDEITSLRVIPALSSKQLERKLANESPPRQFEAGLTVVLGSAAIEVDGPSIKPLKLAGGYTVEMLRPIADQIAERVNQNEPAKLFNDDSQVKVEVVHAEPGPKEDHEADQREAAAQPADSKIEVERHDVGVTLRVPPRGLRRGSAGLFTFGLIWTAFSVVSFGSALISQISGGGAQDPWEYVVIGLFALVFLGVGVGLLLAGIHMGKRRVVIDVIKPTLLITMRSPLKSKQQEWTADDLEQIHMGPSGMEVNDVPVMCLRIEPQQGKAAKYLTGHEKPELRWLAALIRTELGKQRPRDAWDELDRMDTGG